MRVRPRRISPRTAPTTSSCLPTITHNSRPRCLRESDRAVEFYAHTPIKGKTQKAGSMSLEISRVVGIVIEVTDKGRCERSCFAMRGRL